MGSSLLPATAIDDSAPARLLSDPPVGPRLLWPSIRYEGGIEDEDAPRFPARGKVAGRYKAGKDGRSLKLVAFETSVRTSEVRILVLDPHFDESGAKVLEPALPSSQASDVRLLTGGGDIARERREHLRQGLTRRLNLNRSYLPRIEVRWNADLDKRKFPFLHDRFAIVDGALWHFGSTVGGSHSGLTAASGPWSTAATWAVEFFEECWSSCNA